MQTLKLLLLTIFTTFLTVSFGQEASPSIINYSTRDYGKEYNPEIYCATQDNRGVMYFGTGNGVLEFDGAYWRYVKVQAGSYVRAIGTDSTGRVYVGTMGDFGYLKGDKSGQIQYHSLFEKIPLDDQFFSEIWNIETTTSKVYFQAQSVFFEYDIETEEIVAVYPTETSSFHTSFMVDGIFHVRAREIGIVQYVEDDLERLRGTENVRGLGVFGVHKLDDDSLLVITQEIGIWKYKNKFFRQLPDNNPVSLNSLGIFGSIQLADGNIALWTFTTGVYIIDAEGNLVGHFDKNNGLASNDVKSIFQDRDQNLWICTGNGMAMMDYYSPLSYYSAMHGIDGSVQAICRYQGKLYLGTSNGLFRQSSVGPKVFENTGLINSQVWGFEQVDDKLLVATSQGIYETNNGDGFVLKTTSQESANKILYLPEKELIVSAGSFGIHVYNKNMVEKYSYDEAFSTVLGICENPHKRGVIWVGTVANGAYRLDMRGERYKVDMFGDFDGLLDDLGKPMIYNDSLVFGSKEGLDYFIDEETMKAQLTPEEQEDPLNYMGMFQTQPFHDLSSSEQFLFLETSANRDWYSEDNYSIAYFDKVAEEFVTKPFAGVDYGRINEFYLEENGVLWVGTVDGLIRYKENAIKNYDNEVNVLIRKFMVGTDSVAFNGSFNSEGQIINTQPKDFNVSLDYTNNDIAISFASPSFSGGHPLEFSYILEGYSSKWSKWSGKTESNFTNLHEGDYTFKVKGRNIYGVTSEEATFSFSISPPWYRTALAYVGYVLAMLILFFVGFRIFSARLKKRNIWLEGVVEERTKEISEKNEVLHEQKKEIEDSINYAQRIQEALLPLEEEMKKWVPNSFVLFKPKDIVSGDFYWFTKTGNKLVFICADCTGHGVPGAFMSMIGSDRLNIIVEERNIVNPGLILSELNIAIKRSLKQDGEKGSTKDGMDAAVCMIDLDTKELRYAGANRPLWIVDENGLEEIKATKVAVAGFTPDSQVFKEHVIPLKNGLKFYMTSDGYADQFGGERGKKLKVKTMKQLILEGCNDDYAIQKEKLDKHLVEWMGDHEQIDDVCVVGFQMEI
ncbi:MAG: SpoIIE family protein phosphatase [Crocinitomicaceae bacterium]